LVSNVKNGTQAARQRNRLEATELVGWRYRIVHLKCIVKVHLAVAGGVDGDANRRTSRYRAVNRIVAAA